MFRSRSATGWNQQDALEAPLQRALAGQRSGCARSGCARSASTAPTTQLCTAAARPERHRAPAAAAKCEGLRSSCGTVKPRAAVHYAWLAPGQQQQQQQAAACSIRAFRGAVHLTLLLSLPSSKPPHMVHY